MRTVAAVVASAMLLHASPSTAQHTITGWTVTTNVTTDSGDHAHRTSMATRQQIAPNFVRIEYTQVSGERGPIGDAEGMYLVMRGADTTLLMVMPQQRIASITGMGQMIAPMQASMKDAARPADTRTMTRTVDDLGAGERILGHATRHFRVTSKGSVFYADLKCTRRVDAETEFWIAPDVDIDTPMEQAFKSAMPGMSLDDETSDKPSTSDLPKGTEMRSIRRSWEHDATGKSIVITTTSEIVELQHGELADSLFQAPKDFHVVDTRPFMKDIPAGMLDSMMASTSSSMKDVKCGKDQ